MMLSLNRGISMVLWRGYWLASIAPESLIVREIAINEARSKGERFVRFVPANAGNIKLGVDGTGFYFRTPQPARENTKSIQREGAIYRATVEVVHIYEAQFESRAVARAMRPVSCFEQTACSFPR